MQTQERQLVDAALEAVRRIAGVRGRVVREYARGRDGGGDAVIELERDRRKYRFAVQVKTVDRFQTPALLKARVATVRHPPLLVAPYIAPETAQRCRDTHVSFIDTAGNTFLDAPGLFVYVTGQRRAQEWKHGRFRALNPAGLRIVFALLCRPELIRATYRELATAAAVALGAVGPVLRDLHARGFLRFDGRKPQALTDPLRLVEEWVTYYPILLRPRLHPRRFYAVPDLLREAHLDGYGAYWGGEVAAERMTHFLQPGAFTIYVREPAKRLLADHRMRADQQGNVEILDAFWHFETTVGPPDIVPPILAYADLLATRDQRNIEAARLIYEQWIRPTLHQAA